MGQPGKEAIHKLESCGLQFARITPGEYSVGLDANTEAKLLAQPPQFDWYEPLVTPSQHITVGEFWIATDVLRLSHWQNMLDHPGLPDLADLLPADHLEEIAARRTASTTITVEPTAGESQATWNEAEPKDIPMQPNLDPAIAVGAQTALKIAGALGASIPRWYEWEIATRGAEGQLYPWGDEMDVNLLSIEHQDYSVDEESTMGYYCYNQDVYFVHSFGPYIGRPSPFELIGLAQAGQEWNRCDATAPLGEETLILRSLSDLGCMSMMIPGLRPNTWGGTGSWSRTRRHLAFSGPVLPCYAPADIGLDQARQSLFPEAAFRLVFAPSRFAQKQVDVSPR